MQIILGTVQLGLNYGITNFNGKPSLSESLDIIQYALDNNINTFDTARAYGNSEYILGLANKKYNNLNIITKLAPLNDISKSISNDALYGMIDDSIKTSMNNLNITKLDTLLLHRFEHYNNKIIWNYLLENKNIDVIKNLGVSVYYVNEAIKVLKDKNIKHIQLPINILDNQWFSEEFLQLLNKRKDVVIHCRSILLQGILISSADKWPKIENVDAKIYINNLNDLVKEFNFNNRIELCFSYIKSIDWINGILIGVDNLQQLKDNINFFKVRKLTKEEFLLVRKIFNNVPNNLLNPSLWSL
jgi:aryl-alcohol dehydrogenase-like predicted oxidoreductase